VERDALHGLALVYQENICKEKGRKGKKERGDYALKSERNGEKESGKPALGG